MELWFDLLFGNPIGIFSMITVFSSIIVVGYILAMLIRKSARQTP